MVEATTAFRLDPSSILDEINKLLNKLPLILQVHN